MDALAASTRLLVLQTLERIQASLLQLIGLGNPSLKRYFLVSAILAQIRAMQAGENVQTAVMATGKVILRKVAEMMRRFVAKLNVEGSVNGRGEVDIVSEDAEAVRVVVLTCL